MNLDLENFRLRSIKEIKEQSKLLRDLISTIDSLNLDLYIIGSVLDRKKFNENSDVDLAVVTDANYKVRWKIVQVLQKVPFEFGTLDVSIFDSDLEIKGKRIKL